jgi:hypothetical protein
MNGRGKLLKSVLCVLGVALTLASPVAADVGYVSDGILGRFWTMEVPGAQLGGSDLPNLPASGLAISPSGELFAVKTALLRSEPMQLVRMDPVTHALEVRGPLAIATLSPWDDVGLAFDATGRLWLVTEQGKLYQVDPTNAAATLRADFHVTVNGLAGCGATLFSLTHQGLGPYRVARIDPYRATITTVGAGTSQVWEGGGAGLDFSADGRLWAVLRNDPAIDPMPPISFLAEFDPVTGELLSHINHPFEFEGFALAPPPATCRGVAAPDVPSLCSAGFIVLAGMLTLVAAMMLRSRPS